MRFRRAIVPGGCYFFTARLATRDSRLLVDHAYVLKKVVRRIRAAHPFAIDAWVTMPDHLHAVLTLPDGDDRFAMRWSLIETSFAHELATDRRLWQRRFREHLIRDDDDLRRHVDYVHFNPVRHGLVARAADWPFSSMHRHVRAGTLAPDWSPTRRRWS